MKKILFLFVCIFSSFALWSQEMVPFYDPTYENWGYCNRKKEIVIYPQYNDALPFANGLAVVKKGEHYGLINQYGEAVGDLKYEKIHPFSEGLAAVVLDDKVGFINSFGEEVIPPKYDNQKYGDIVFSEGRTAVLTGGKYGYIDQSGTQITDFIFKEAEPYNGGFAVVKSEDSEFSFIDPQGKLIAKLPGITSVGDYNEGLIDVVKNEKTTGYIDKTGKEIIPFKYSRGYKFSNGLAYVKEGKKQMFIDKTGKPVIELKCDDLWAARFSNGLALIKRDGKAGYINKKGEEVIPCKYESARDFKDGYAIVGSSKYTEGRMVDYKGVIDTTGKIVLPLIYNLYSVDYVPEHGLLKLYSDPAYGYVSIDGINYTDVYTNIKRISLEELFKPDISEYPKYIVGNFSDFQLTDDKGTTFYPVKKDNSKEYFRIKDMGNGLVELSFYKETHDYYAYSTEGTNFTGQLSLKVSWGDLPSIEATSDTKEKLGFILSSPQGYDASTIKDVWGYYKIRAEELILYINFLDGKQFKLRGKRIYDSW